MASPTRKILLLPRAYMDLEQNAFDFLSLSKKEKESYQKLLSVSDLQKRLEHYCEDQDLQLKIISSTQIIVKKDTLLALKKRIAELVPDIIIFVSKHAALAAKLALPEQIFEKSTVCSVGKGAQIFFDEKITQVMSAKKESAEGLLEIDLLKNIKNKNVMLCRGEQGLDDLEIICKARGANVELVNLYQRVANTQLSLMDTNNIAGVYGVSVYALSHFLEALPEQARLDALQLPVFAMSERILKAAKKMGFVNVSLKTV